MVNLFVNAMQAIPNGGKITIKTLYKKDNIYLTIQDTGIGMSKEIMEHIFKPFFTTKEEMGTGLGLSVVQNIVKSYNGFINVKSSIGKGTKFEIKLPAQKV